MKYLVHVVDEASKYIFENGEYTLDKALSDIGEPCDLVRSDCFYCVEAKEKSEAVINVAHAIRILDENEKPVSLSLMIAKTYENQVSSEVGLSGSSLLDPFELDVATNNISTLTTATCQIIRSGEEKNWIENHVIYFYVSPQNEIVSLKS